MSNLLIQFQTYAQANPVLAGAASLWGIGVMTMMCRTLPEKIWEFFVTHMTTSLYLDSSENGESALNFLSFMRWYEKNGYSKYSRTMALDSAKPPRDIFDEPSYNKDVSSSKTPMHCSIGDGFHFFFRNYKFFWLYRKRIDKPGIAKNLYSVSLHYIGRNKKIMYDLISEFAYVPDTRKTGMYTYDGYDWDYQNHITPRKINTVIINKDIKKSVTTTLDQFFASQAWYEHRGMAYKKTIILHGVPGTGKTSFIKALADHYSRNLCVMNIGLMNDGNIAKSLSNVPARSFVVIEDCDSSKATHSRETEPPSADGTKSLSMSGLLNALDGLTALNDTIIFLTTNHLSSLDSAMTRKGRVDHIYELKELEDEEIVEYIHLMFPIHPKITQSFNPILGCDLQSLYISNAHNYKEFINSIPKL